MNPIECQRKAFRLPDDLHYLNCAYMSPLPAVVEQAGVDALTKLRNPALFSTSDFFDPAERIRAAFAKLVNAPDASRVSLIPAASYGIATAARNMHVEPGDEILVIEEQFPSNIYSWKRLAAETSARLKIVNTPDVPIGQRAEAWSRHILDAIGARTRVVALPHVHWTDGTRFDLEAIGARSRDVGAWFVIDGTQSVGAMPFHVPTIQPDVLVVAGYKWMMGPYATGVAWWSERMLDGTPLEENWINRRGSKDFAGLVDYEDAYAEGAIRYDVGERSNFTLLPMLEAALNLLLDWTPEGVQAYCNALTAEPLSRLTEMGFTKGTTGHHLFGLRLPKGLDPEETRLALQEAGVSVSVRGSAVRVSPHVYNTGRDLDVFMDVLEGLTRS